MHIQNRKIMDNKCIFMRATKLNESHEPRTRFDRKAKLFYLKSAQKTQFFVISSRHKTKLNWKIVIFLPLAVALWIYISICIHKRRIRENSTATATTATTITTKATKIHTEKKPEHQQRDTVGFLICSLTIHSAKLSFQFQLFRFVALSTNHRVLSVYVLCFFYFSSLLSRVCVFFFLSSSDDRRDFVFSMRFSFLWSYLLLHFYVCLTLLIVDSKLFCFLFFCAGFFSSRCCSLRNLPFKVHLL